MCFVETCEFDVLIDLIGKRSYLLDNVHSEQGCNTFYSNVVLHLSFVVRHTVYFWLVRL